MVKFQFDGDVDYFELDHVAYAQALGDKGMASYRACLDDVRATLGPEPPESQRFSVPDRHERWVLQWNDRRLAVLGHDIDAIIRTHARDRKVAAWLEDTARAFEEIGEIDLAIDLAKQATDFGRGHQSLKAAAHWRKLLDEHLPGRILGSAASGPPALALLDDGSASVQGRGKSWAEYRDELTPATVSSPSTLGAASPLMPMQSSFRLRTLPMCVVAASLRVPGGLLPPKGRSVLMRQPARLAGRSSSPPQWGTERCAWVHKPWSESRR